MSPDSREFLLPRTKVLKKELADLDNKSPFGGCEAGPGTKLCHVRRKFWEGLAAFSAI
jgi:hypothetical protein